MNGGGARHPCATHLSARRCAAHKLRRRRRCAPAWRTKAVPGISRTNSVPVVVIRAQGRRIFWNHLGENTPVALEGVLKFDLSMPSGGHNATMSPFLNAPRSGPGVSGVFFWSPRPAAAPAVAAGRGGLGQVNPAGTITSAMPQAQILSQSWSDTLAVCLSPNLPEGPSMCRGSWMWGADQICIVVTNKGAIIR
jgi:hypothetical protein